MLDGEYFLTRLRLQLDRLQDGLEPGVDRLDLLLSVTSVVPNVSEAANDAAAPVRERRIDGVIRLRHRGGDKSDFVSGDRETQRQRTYDLALAARSTASFPFAFEPVRILPTALQRPLPERRDLLVQQPGDPTDL